MKKEEEYAMKIVSQIAQLFDEDCENHIELSELGNDDNGTHFTHALCNLAPALILKKLESGIENTLDLNHLANNLIFQYERNKRKEESK
jgi:hypothetical protein